MEGICINLELSFLKLALIKLAKNETVIFRGNDLLRLLEDTFTGLNFSLFIACINPADSNTTKHTELSSIATLSKD